MKKIACIINVMLLFCLAFVANVEAQPKSVRMTPEEYIQSFREAAVADMVKTGVPASITMAQGMYESDYGNSPLALNAKNHFGIKCHKEWEGPTYHQDDDAADECFRKYEEVQQSYDDHSYFLRSRERYNSLFELEITDYKGWAKGLKKAGYATNPAYAEKLIDLIERYNLAELDRSGLALMKGGKADAKASDQANAGTNHRHRHETGSRLSLPVPADNTGQDAPKTTRVDKVKTPVVNTDNTINDVPFVRVKKGDTWMKISRENKRELWEILAFNDAEPGYVLHEGDVVFIRSKKNKAEVEKHVVQQGETMWMISQRYAVKKERIYRMNKLDFDVEPKPGEVLILNKPLLLGMSL